VGERQLALGTPPQLRPDGENPGADIRAELQSCLALARCTAAAAASGERLKAARSAVDLVRAYDRVLENIRLVPLSSQEQQRARDQLAPVRELLRKYRLR